jgi:hypothetical protein
MDDNKIKIPINVKADPITVEQLDSMVFEDDTDRAKFIRRLIRKEFEARKAIKEWNNSSKEDQAALSSV